MPRGAVVLLLLIAAAASGVALDLGEQVRTTRAEIKALHSIQQQITAIVYQQCLRDRQRDAAGVELVNLLTSEPARLVNEEDRLHRTAALARVGAQWAPPIQQCVASVATPAPSPTP